ncbi:MAG: hypothetical protein P8M34_10715 [Saprospiraceae bacterium]|nr:hypothetical protein [Saprospiraceae bacterium]
MDKAVISYLSLPDHLKAIVSDVIGNDATSKLSFLAEGLKDENTGKKTFTREMTPIGVGENGILKHLRLLKEKIMQIGCLLLQFNSLIDGMRSIN